MREISVKIVFGSYGPKYGVCLTFSVVLGIVSMLLNVTMIHVAIPVIMSTFGAG